MAGDERLLLVNDLVHAEVRVEVCLDVLEDGDGAVRPAAAKHARRGDLGRDANCVVEREPKRLVHVLAALAVIEEACLEVVGNSEELAAGRVCCGVYTVVACDTAR